jgi:hypothetical protein
MLKYCITNLRVMNRHVLNRRMTILAGTVIVTTLMMMTAPTVYAGSPSPPDLTIDEFGIDDGNPFLTVEGTAGGTIPDEKDKADIYAHVFDTDKGVFAVASHPGFEDSPDEQPPIEAWHGHGLELTEDQPPCIVENSINDDGKAVVEGKTVTLDTSDLEEEDRPTEVDSVLTAVLSAEKKGGGDDDTGEDETAICVVKVFSEG